MITSLTPSQGIQIAIYGFLTVFIMLAALMLIIMIMGKVAGTATKKKEEPVIAPVVAEEKVEEKIDTTEYVGDVLLFDVDEKTAACIMAIVSDTTGIPLNNLIFKRIKYIGEE